MLSDIWWYLAGPMSGRPQFNIPLFDKSAALLRARGFKVVNPAELDSRKMRELALKSAEGRLEDLQDAGEGWAEVLSRDVRIVGGEVGGVILLPEWYQSRGAKLEAFVGLLTSKEFAMYEPDSGRLMEISPAFVRDMLRRNMP